MPKSGHVYSQPQCIGTRLHSPLIERWAQRIIVASLRTFRIRRRSISPQRQSCLCRTAMAEILLECLRPEMRLPLAQRRARQRGVFATTGLSEAHCMECNILSLETEADSCERINRSRGGGARERYFGGVFERALARLLKTCLFTSGSKSHFPHHPPPTPCDCDPTRCSLGTLEHP